MIRRPPAHALLAHALLGLALLGLVPSTAAPLAGAATTGATTASMPADTPRPPMAPWPSEDPEGWLLAHVDVETTGLDPAWHGMTDLGIAWSTLDGVELERLYLRILPAHPERADPGALAVNGFDEAYWRAHGAIDEAEAVRLFTAAHARVRGDRQVLFTGFNAWFDQGFTSALFARHGVAWRGLFHYHVLDLPSMAWARGCRGVTGPLLARELGLPAETRVPIEHTGMTGVDFNLSVYRALLAGRGCAGGGSDAPG